MISLINNCLWNYNVIMLDADLLIYNNGWVPQKKDLTEIEYNDKKYYIDLGARIPPKPGIPRSKEETNLIIQKIKEHFDTIKN